MFLFGVLPLCVQLERGLHGAEEVVLHGCRLGCKIKPLVIGCGKCSSGDTKLLLASDSGVLLELEVGLGLGFRVNSVRAQINRSMSDLLP